MEDCSHKLYYYNNSKLFQCYTTGSNFDVFELVIKIHQIQKNQKMELYDAVRFIAYKFGFSADKEDENKKDELQILPNFIDKSISEFNTWKNSLKNTNIIFIFYNLLFILD